MNKIRLGSFLLMHSLFFGSDIMNFNYSDDRNDFKVNLDKELLEKDRKNHMKLSKKQRKKLGIKYGR
jgi:hypothetical protein